MSAFHFLVAITALHLMFSVNKGTARHLEAVQKDLKSLTDLHISATVVKSTILQVNGKFAELSRDMYVEIVAKEQETYLETDMHDWVCMCHYHTTCMHA